MGRFLKLEFKTLGGFFKLFSQVDTEAGEEDEAARYLNFLVFYFAIFKNYLYIFL